MPSLEVCPCSKSSTIHYSEHLRNIWVSRANISFQLSYRFVKSSSGSCFNCTAVPALRNPRPAQRDYRALSASTCRTVFARAAHRVVCRACPCRLVMLWLVPSRERACQLWRFLNVTRSMESLLWSVERGWELSYPSCRNHPPGLRLSRFALFGLRGEVVCTHLGCFCGGFSG